MSQAANCKTMINSFPSSLRTVRILGTHGVPANYGGFETAAEAVARYLVGKGWRVIVYCQVDGRGVIREDVWEGIERVIIPINWPGWRGTSAFDWISIRHASAHRDLCLTFGYNTGSFNVRQRMKGILNIINMDGIEWSRARWGIAKQSLLYLNERFAAWFGDHLIADHPDIRTYLLTRAPARKITTIAYGAYSIASAPIDPVTALRLAPGRYLSLIARPIPENSLLEIIRAFSRQRRGVHLAVLGQLNLKSDDYHRDVHAAASDEVLFLGNIFDPVIVRALRFHSVGYLHGHTVGGTNPSLIEAMAAGNPVIAHDNSYNRRVARDGALYFTDVDDADTHISRLIADDALRQRLGAANRARHAAEFTWDHIGDQYERLMIDLLARHRTAKR